MYAVDNAMKRQKSLKAWSFVISPGDVPGLSIEKGFPTVIVLNLKFL